MVSLKCLRQIIECLKYPSPIPNAPGRGDPPPTLLRNSACGVYVKERICGMRILGVDRQFSISKSIRSKTFLFLGGPRLMGGPPPFLGPNRGPINESICVSAHPDNDRRSIELSLTLSLPLTLSVAISSATNILGNWPGAMSRKGEVKGVIHVQYKGRWGVKSFLF